MAVRYVKRHGLPSRVLHWAVAVSCAVLVLSGLGLYDGNFRILLQFFGGGARAIWVHGVAGAVFAATSILLSLLHLPHTLSFDADDVRWLQSFGGYLSRNAEEPPMGKFNTGQKLFDLVSLGCTIGFAVTGWILWNRAAYGPEAIASALSWHSLLFVVLATFLVVHVYLGTIGNPGTLSGMLWGEVSEAWARKHAPKWLAKLQGR